MLLFWGTNIVRFYKKQNKNFKNHPFNLVITLIYSIILQ
jgi:hypothetical protein